MSYIIEKERFYMDEINELEVNLTPFEQAAFNMYTFANGLYTDYMLQVAYPTYFEGLEELKEACREGDYLLAQDLAKKLSQMEESIEHELDCLALIGEA
jgi:hypothetical protein